MKFEEYLQNNFQKNNPQILDDDFPDAFDNWLADVEVQEIIDLAEKWGDKETHFDEDEGIVLGEDFKNIIK